MKLISMREFVRRFRIVPGERISPNAIVLSSTTKKVPFGDTLGVPSGAVVATNPRSCSSIIRVMSGVSIFGFLRCIAKDESRFVDFSHWSTKASRGPSNFHLDYHNVACWHQTDLVTASRGGR